MINRHWHAFILTIITMLLAAVPAPAQAQGLTPQTATARPIVHALMLWMNGCPHCEDIINNVLPPLRAQYGYQLDLQLVEVVSLDDVTRLYEISSAYGFTREQTGVPFLIIGETPLAGADDIRAQLPLLVAQHLARGGVAVPEKIKNLLPIPTASPHKTIVYIFWGDGCPHCEAARPFLRSLEQANPDMEIREYEVWGSPENQALFAKMAAVFEFEPKYVPTIIIGERYWEGFAEEMQPELESAIAECAKTSCPDAGQGIVTLPTTIPESTSSSDDQPTPSATAIPGAAPAEARDTGFGLAWFVLLFMLAALITCLIAFVLGKSLPLPAWVDWLIPLIIVFGIGVAGYLSYVEVQSVAAMCGPIGDCNAVQSSPYARLFGILPVGLLGLLGYLGLLAAWLARKYLPRWEKIAALAFLGMAIFATLFSIYLTFLEIQVIKAVCAWCLTSAVLVTLLLLLGFTPAMRTQPAGQAKK